jgi:hypothetical protein
MTYTYASPTANNHKLTASPITTIPTTSFDTPTYSGTCTTSTSLANPMAVGKEMPISRNVIAVPNATVVLLD